MRRQASIARCSRPRRAPMTSTPGCSRRPTPATPRSTASSGLRGGEHVHSSSRFRGPAALSRLERLRRTARHGLDRHLGAPVGRPALDRLAAPRPQTLSRLRLRPRPSPVRRPTAVRARRPGGGRGAAARRGRRARHPPAARRARAPSVISVLQAAFPPGLTGRAARRARRGHRRRRGSRARARSRVPRSGALRAACGSVTADLGGRRVALRPEGTVADVLDRARRCARAAATARSA